MSDRDKPALIKNIYHDFRVGKNAMVINVSSRQTLRAKLATKVICVGLRIAGYTGHVREISG